MLLWGPVRLSVQFKLNIGRIHCCPWILSCPLNGWPNRMAILGSSKLVESRMSKPGSDRKHFNFSDAVFAKEIFRESKKDARQSMKQTSDAFLVFSQTCYLSMFLMFNNTWAVIPRLRPEIRWCRVRKEAWGPRYQPGNVGSVWSLAQALCSMVVRWVAFWFHNKGSGNDSSHSLGETISVLPVKTKW